MCYIFEQRIRKDCAGLQLLEMDQVRHTHVILTQPYLIFKGKRETKTKQRAQTRPTTGSDPKNAVTVHGVFLPSILQSPFFSSACTAKFCIGLLRK